MVKKNTKIAGKSHSAVRSKVIGNSTRAKPTVGGTTLKNTPEVAIRNWWKRRIPVAIKATIGKILVRALQRVSKSRSKRPKTAPMVLINAL
jgi:hypothetical protein